MCEPISATAALAAGSFGLNALQVVSSQSAANAQAQRNAQTQANNNEMNRRAALKNMVEQQADVSSREQQERAAVGLNRLNQKINSKQASATAYASSDSSGQSIETLLNDYEQQYTAYSDSQLTQLGFNQEQLNRSRKQIQSQTLNSINSGWDTSVQVKESWASTLVDLAATGVNTFNKFSSTDPKTGKRGLY